MNNGYFILSKTKEHGIADNSENQLISLNNKRYNYILPAINLKYYVEYGLFEKQLIDWSREFADSTKNMLDIGSHTGIYTISLCNRFKHVYAFEPQKMTYYSLCGSVALSNCKNVTCFNVGLGSAEQIGNQTLNIYSEDGGSSSLHLNGNEPLETESVKIETLDSFGFSNIGFIKMDVEENELNVLMGATETLKNSNYPTILFESNHHNEELYSFIKSLGYSLIKVQNTNNMFLASKHI